MLQSSLSEVYIFTFGDEDYQDDEVSVIRSSVLPVNVLNDLVRSYMLPGGGVMPQFLQSSFEMLRENQSKMMENMSAMNPMSQMPGFDAMQAQQQAFLKAMTGGLSGGWSGPDKDDDAKSEPKEDLDDIKKQLAELQQKLSKLN